MERGAILMNKPCRNCMNARCDTYRNGKQMFNEDYRKIQCRYCYKLEQYRMKLQEKRKYEKGQQIRTMEQFVNWIDNHSFIYWNGKIYHRGWVTSWQYKMIESIVKSGRVFEAVKKNEQRNEGDDKGC